MPIPRAREPFAATLFYAAYPRGRITRSATAARVYGMRGVFYWSFPDPSQRERQLANFYGLTPRELRRRTVWHPTAGLRFLEVSVIKTAIE